jgi:hypothetical protein
VQNRESDSVGVKPRPPGLLLQMGDSDQPGRVQLRTWPRQQRTIRCG